MMKAVLKNEDVPKDGSSGRGAGGSVSGSARGGSAPGNLLGVVSASDGTARGADFILGGGGFTSRRLGHMGQGHGGRGGERGGHGGQGHHEQRRQVKATVGMREPGGFSIPTWIEDLFENAEDIAPRRTSLRPFVEHQQTTHPYQDHSQLSQPVVEMNGMKSADSMASPTGSLNFSFSRTSSTGSLPAAGCTSSASSAHNTDDEDSESSKVPTYKDRRREAHTVAEQKRRDAIKKGYDELQHIVPTCQQPDTLGSQKISKATVLQRSIDYMQFLSNQKKKQEEELESLRKEVMALKIMKANYEHIVKTHQSAPSHGQNQVSDEVKFQVFRSTMDSLFQSFNRSISVANFAELSACVFSWLEEYCKPQTLRDLVLGILRQVSSTVNNQ